MEHWSGEERRGAESVRGGVSGWGSAKRKPSKAPGEKDTWEPKVSTVRVERSRRSVVVEGRARVRDFGRDGMPKGRRGGSGVQLMMRSTETRRKMSGSLVTSMRSIEYRTDSQFGNSEFREKTLVVSFRARNRN